MSVDRKEAARLALKCLAAMGSNEDNVAAKDVSVNNVCRLWAGMGYIYDVSVFGGKQHFIVKRVLPPSKNSRSFGDERKAFSYLVEANFYDNVASKLISDHGLAIPTPFHVERAQNDEVTICMSRLEGRPGGLGSDDQVHAVLRWLATLHAATWGSDRVDALVSTDGLQPTGSYWYLDTRPDEHDSMSRRGWEGRLKRAARAIDGRLKRDRMQCVVHGDAKDANMIFTKGKDGVEEVFMYDFQYCGKAPPTVDLAYFFCVAVGCGGDYGDYLGYYHGELTRRLGPDDYRPSMKELEDSLAIAFCDYQRFMSGWGNWGSDLSSVVNTVLDRLDGGKDLKTDEAYEEAIRREYVDGTVSD